MPHDLHSPLSPENIAEFLADREGLAGKAREHFRRLVHEYGGFRASSTPRHSRTLMLVSLFLALVGLVLDYLSGLSDSVGWASYGLLAAGLSWGLHRDEIKGQTSDLETDWEAYCLFLRPVILSDHPGLLDRNAKDNGRGPTKFVHRTGPALSGLFHDQGPDFWWSAVLGLWLGMVALVVTHLAGKGTSWMGSIAFPAVGLLLGLVTWLLWRRLAYVIVKSDSRVVEP